MNTRAPFTTYAPGVLRVLLYLYVLPGCHQGANNDSFQDISPESSAWTCTFGSAGGFTGGGSGYEILSTGQVLTWEQITPQHPLEKKVIGQASPEQLEELSIALHTPGLRSIEFAQSGNMTSFLEIEWQDNNQRWSWPVGTTSGRATKIPELVRDCFESAQSIARQAEKSP
jgi:hypothetical protein